MREKLIELIEEAYYCSIEELADHLIANGVTFATDNNVGSKWISVKDRLPGLYDDVLLYFKDDDNMAAGYLDDVDEDRSSWVAYSDGGYYTDCDYNPTHWMPLPQPPKGE